MTDNEIIKALEYCRRTDRYVICNSDCPMYEYCESDEEGEMNICGLALDLINRKKAEIEGLKSRIFALNDTNQKLIDSQEIYWRNRVKEFAERLKENIDNGQLYNDGEDYALTIWHIDNLVKKMTEGEDNA